MCVLCGITQSVTLLSIGYSPTPVDMELLTKMNEQVKIVAQSEDTEALLRLDDKVEETKPKVDSTENKQAQYIVYALDDLIEYHKLFSQ